MNAHADMFIVAEHNELNTPRGIYRSLVSGVWKFARFRSAKTSANKRLLLCLLPFAADVRHPSAQVHGAKVVNYFGLSKKKRILLRFFLGYFLHISKLNSTFEHLSAAHSLCSIQLKIIRQTYAHDPINWMSSGVQFVPLLKYWCLTIYAQ